MELEVLLYMYDLVFETEGRFFRIVQNAAVCVYIYIYVIVTW